MKRLLMLACLAIIAAGVPLIVRRMPPVPAPPMVYGKYGVIPMDVQVQGGRTLYPYYVRCGNSEVWGYTDLRGCDCKIYDQTPDPPLAVVTCYDKRGNPLDVLSWTFKPENMENQ